MYLKFITTMMLSRWASILSWPQACNFKLRSNNCSCSFFFVFFPSSLLSFLPFLSPLLSCFLSLYFFCFSLLFSPTFSLSETFRHVDSLWRALSSLSSYNWFFITFRSQHMSPEWLSLSFLFKRTLFPTCHLAIFIPLHYFLQSFCYYWKIIKYVCMCVCPKIYMCLCFHFSLCFVL